MLSNFFEQTTLELEEMPEKMSIGLAINLGLLVFLPIIGVFTFYFFGNTGKHAKLFLIFIVLGMQIFMKIALLVVFSVIELFI